ncbi:MAG: ribonuclease HII [Candidatus Wildermuthbacteria bacterium]|nr:ribonuclease HII [Candidatus Wildermuthbacteria bacterium]
MIPKITEEKKLWKQGYQYIACIDEAGRGPLAGPVVAAAVIILPNCTAKLALGKEYLPRASFARLKDSKKLSPKRREFFYNLIIKNECIRWGIGIVSEKIIDQINIFQATKLTMQKAVLELDKKIKAGALSKNPHNTNLCYSKEMYYIDFLIVDGNNELSFNNIPCKAIVKGDEKVFSCALASIIAKVTRDRIMLKYHKKYPQYGFDKHKGYGTRLHMAMLKKYGPCSIHRQSFSPIAKFQNPK